MTTQRPGRGQRRPAVDLPVPDAGFESGLYVPLNDVMLGDTGGAQVLVNGNLAVSWVDSTFEGELDGNGELDRANAGINLSGAATLELALAAGTDVAGSCRLALITLPSFTVGGITASPFVQVKVKLEATADADGCISVVAPFGIGSGFSYDGAPHAGLSTPPRYTPEIGLPDAVINLSGTVELEVVLAVLLAIEAIPIGGPVLGTSLGVTLELDSASGWDVDGFIKIVGDWTFPDPATPTLPNIPEDLGILHAPPPFDIADGPFPVVATPTRWSRVFDIANDDGAAAALPAGDGLIVVETSPNPWLAELDRLGIPRWQSTAATSWSPAGMVYDADGGFLVAGTSGNSMRVDRFDLGGQPLWTRTMSVAGADTTTCTAIVRTTSDTTILAGKVNRRGVPSLLLAAIDEAGDVEWSIEVDTGSGSTQPTIAALALLPSGDIIAVGSVHHADSGLPPEPPIGGKNALILKLDARGTLLGAYALGGTSAEEAMRIAVHPDNGTYTIAGHLEPRPNVWIASMSADNTLRWSASYQNRPDDSGIDYANPTGLATLDGNGLLVSGYIGAPDRDAFLMRLADNGQPVWVKSYIAEDSSETLSGVIALRDGLIAYGRTQVLEEKNSYGDLWIVRTNVDAGLRFTPDSGLTTVNTAVQWCRIHDHTIRALAPESVTTTLTSRSTNSVVHPASATGELIAGVF